MNGPIACTRRAALTGSAAVLLSGLPAYASEFPAALDWRMRVGPVAVPFILDGTPGDPQAFREAMRRALRATLLQDVPQILGDSRSSRLQDYLMLAKVAASRVEEATRKSVVAPKAPAIHDAVKRRAYATIAGAACLLRWKSAALAPSLADVATIKNSPQEGVRLPFTAENLGIAFGDAISAFASPGSKSPSSMTSARPIQTWEMGFVALQMNKVFAGFRGRPSEEAARHLQFAADYVAFMRDPRSLGPGDEDQRAASGYADALLTAAAASFWPALAA